MTYEKIKNNKIIRAICAFQRSKVYVYVLAAMALISNLFGLDGFSFVPVLALMCFTNLFSDSVLPALPAVFTIVFGVSPEHSPSDGDYSYYLSAPFLCCVAPLVFAVIATAVWRFIKDENYKNINLASGLGGGIALYAVGLLLGGAFSDGYAITDFALAALIAFTLAPFYFFFAATIKKEDINYEYICETLVVSGLVVLFELIVFYIKNYTPETLLTLNNYDWKGKMQFGWGISNTAGMYMAFVIPTCFYFAIKKGQAVKSFLLSALFMTGVYFTLCRSGILFGAIAFAICAIICCVYGENKPANAVCAALCLVVAGGVLAIILGGYPSVKEFLKNASKDAGRFRTWEDAFSLYLKNPVFGAGFLGFYREYPEKYSFFTAFSHNTIFQLLCACGTFGILGYLYHRAQTIKLFLHKITPIRALFLVQTATLLCMGMLDIAMITPYFTMPYAIILAFLEKESGENELIVGKRLSLCPFCGYNGRKNKKENESKASK